MMISTLESPLVRIEMTPSKITQTQCCHVGYGSSAVVYEAIYKPLKKRVAVKMIDLDMFERNQIDELRVFIHEQPLLYI